MAIKKKAVRTKISVDKVAIRAKKTPTKKPKSNVVFKAKKPAFEAPEPKRTYRVGLWPELPPGMTITRHIPNNIIVRKIKPERFTLHIKVSSPGQDVLRNFSFTSANYLERMQEAFDALRELRDFDASKYTVIPTWAQVMVRLEVKQTVVKEVKYVYTEREVKKGK